MTDTVKLIIEISKETYDHVCDVYNRLPTPKEEMEIEDSIRNCTRLSKTMQDIKTDIWYSGVNMAGEYKGVWVRYKNIEEIIDKHINGEKNNESP